MSHVHSNFKCRRIYTPQRIHLSQLLMNAAAWRLPICAGFPAEQLGSRDVLPTFHFVSRIAMSSCLIPDTITWTIQSSLFGNCLWREVLAVWLTFYCSILRNSLANWSLDSRPSLWIQFHLHTKIPLRLYYINYFVRLMHQRPSIAILNYIDTLLSHD